MEHRCTHRYSSDLKVLILKHNMPIAIGRIRNASRSGIFLETDFADIECEHQLRLECMVERTTLLKAGGINMQALVIHKTDKGFGAELEFASEEHADTFFDILSGDNHIQTPSVEEFALAANH